MASALDAEQHVEAMREANRRDDVADRYRLDDERRDRGGPYLPDKDRSVPALFTWPENGPSIREWSRELLRREGDLTAVESGKVDGLSWSGFCCLPHAIRARTFPRGAMRLG